MKTNMICSVLCAAWLVASAANAQSFSGAEVGTDATACAYTFTSGAGAKAFTWCVTVNGNIALFETPAGQNHVVPSAEGFAVCSAAGTHGADFGGFIPVPFGPPTVVSGCTAGATCTISLDTTDAAFRLVQKFSQSTTDKELNIDHTLTNLTATTKTGVVLTRMTGMGPNNDWGDDRGDTSLRSAWLADLDRVGSTASTPLEPASTFIVAGYPTGCAPFATGTPAPPGTYANQINYNLGNIGPLKKRIVRVQIRRD